VELQTASHAVHADGARVATAQVYDEADIGGGQQHHNQDVGEVHALI
jgi:hypothetical protein